MPLRHVALELRFLMLGLFAAAVTQLLSGPAWATQSATAIKHYQYPQASPALSNVPLTAGAATRTTQEVPIAGYSEATVYIEYTAGATAAATHVMLQCWAGRASGKLGAMVVLTDSSTPGTSDSLQHTWRHPVSGSAIIRWVITPLNDAFLQCRVGSEGVVTADDVITRLDYRLGVL